mmetsp:Transcript_13831/g.33482  ORF Transcript_13831/g.33482 Transcript_13831/m.33482 type:complete len:464 (-) Transcript_13831:105-1496(-)
MIDPDVELSPVGSVRKTIDPNNEGPSSADTVQEDDTPDRWNKVLCQLNMKAKHIAIATAFGIVLLLIRTNGSTIFTTHNNFRRSNSRVRINLPRLSKMVDKKHKTIIAPVNKLMEFAIVGFNRCGTTSLKEWIAGVSERVVITSGGAMALGKKNSTYSFVTGQYHKIEGRIRYANDAKHGKRRFFFGMLEKHKEEEEGKKHRHVRSVYGTKSPGLLNTMYGPTALSQHFNETKLIVGIRHPIPWFQSMYNDQLKFHNADTSSNSRRGLKTMPSPADLLNCGNEDYPTRFCGGRVEYHRYLARLHKTSMTSSEERSALRHYGCTDGTRDCKISDKDDLLYPSAPFGGQIMLVELGQLFARKEELRNDLGHFLNLELPDMTPLSKKGLVSDGSINICDEIYSDIRGVLLNHAVRSSRWILRYFIESPDVVVSSREYFIETLENWGTDPCTTRHGRELMRLDDAYA